MSFVHLHCHSSNSMLDGLARPQSLVEKAKELGFTSLALSDHGNVNGAIKFYQECKKQEIKPILAVEAYFVNDASKTEKGERRYHILIMAKSAKGFRSLCKLMTEAHQRFYYFPRIDIQMLMDTEDLIVSTACSYGVLSNPNSERIVQVLKEGFKDDFYLEIMAIFLDTQKTINEYAIKLSEKYNIKLIATNDIHYLNKDQDKIHNFLLKMNTGGRLQFEISGLYMRTEQEMLEAFEEIGFEGTVIQDALNNTQEIADKVNIELEQREIQLPSIYKGDPVEILKEKLNTFSLTKEYKRRLDYELDIIVQKKYVDYFLMVEDFVNHCREIGMELGAGRGSAGGSLICYLLGITGVDPIKEGLMFERFLNPERTDYPDIDIDIPRSRRKEGIEYLKERYGEDRVANISTIAELKIKSAFKDVAREFNVPFFDANNISKLLDNDKTIDETFTESPEIKKAIMSLPDGEEIIQMVEGIAGTYRQSGTHAAGIVVSPYPVKEFGVMEKRGNDYSLNWDMGSLEWLGFVKLDVLGLRTLDIIGECKRLILNRHSKIVNWKKIKVDSEKILNEFEKGNTVGIFQFESFGMTRLVKQLKKITSSTILADCNALGRPGPLDSGLTELYIKRHLGGTDYNESYMKWLKEHDIARDTYRVIIYQEQIIEILQKFAGYSIPEADIVRRIFAKKKGDMNEQRDKFVNGCKKTVEMPEEVSNKLFDALENFSRYGFNKSHAVAYTEFGLRQMWLKVNYPLEYMTSLYKWTDEKDKTERFLEECYRLKIEIKSPHINKSQAEFSIDGKDLRIGFKSIKGVGNVAVDTILKAREMGDFRGLDDFRIRTPVGKVNKTVFNALVLTGAFSDWDINKKHFLENEELYHAIHNAKKKVSEDVEKSFYDELYNEEEFTKDEQELWKLTLLEGVYRPDIQPATGLEINARRLNKLREIIADCDICSIYGNYKNPVTFDFNENSKVFIIGESPGKEELEEGKPFVGRAGDVLWEYLESKLINRSDCFVTNTYCCRFLGNKVPENPPHDCWQYLKKQIEIVKPKLILCLGGTAMEFFTGSRMGIQSRAGKIYNELVDGKYLVPVLYAPHPASTFYADSTKNKELLEESIEKLANIFYGIE